MAIILDLCYFFLCLIYFPVGLMRGKIHTGMKMRLGAIPPASKQILQGKKCIWVHAVSVGEVLAIKDLLGKLHERYKDHLIVCTTVTVTGYQIAVNNLKGKATILFAPLDFSWAVNAYLRIIKPVVYICTETEIWPNLYLSLQRQKVPIIIVNGRISDKSFVRFKQARWLVRKVLSCVSKFCMQSELDAQRVRDLGADPAKVIVTGNIKFDNLPQEEDLKLSDLGFTSGDELLIAGSTHPKEEELIIQAYQEIQRDAPALRLVIAPRHVERAAEVYELAQGLGLLPVYLSRLKTEVGKRNAVVIVDQIGQLRKLYGLAKIVFVGKSFEVGGGQNVLEPAAFGKPIVVGPYTYNFKDIITLFKKEQAIVEVANKADLATEIRKLLMDDNRRQEIGRNAKRLVEQYRGATDKTMQTIGALI